MKRLGLIIAILVILIGGGLLTSALANQPAGAQMPGVAVQTSNTAASAGYMTAEKGVWFLVWAVILTLGPLVTFAVGLTALMWWLNRRVSAEKQSQGAQFSFSLDTSRPNTLGAVLAKHPFVLVVMMVLVIGALAAYAYFSGAFGR